MSYESVSQAFDEFYKVCRSLSKFGASDSEPDGVMQSYLMGSLGFRDTKRPLPRSGRDWQLFTASMPCGEAARQLTAALKNLSKSLKAVVKADPCAKKTIRGYLWRCY
jgi:hypothetical protein